MAEAGEHMDRITKKDFTLQVRNVIDSLSEVREDRVRNLRLQIQKNLYQPNPDEIADRMIEESLQEILRLRKNPN